jgi:hypothetical protein
MDASRLAELATDCIHMVVNNDPGLKAYLASTAPPDVKVNRYLVLMTRSRYDIYPPVSATPTGTHSAVFVPNRPALVRGQRPGASGVCLVDRRERRLSAELRAHGVG